MMHIRPLIYLCLMNQYMFAEMKSVMYERTFLQDVADQNYTKYLVEREIAVPIRVSGLDETSSCSDL